MSNIVNIAVQILPVAPPDRLYALIDAAIEVVVRSGITYRVCPFETVLEGPYDEVMDIVRLMQQACYDAGCDELIVNLKMHMSRTKDLHMDSKTKKYN